jgi:hypothetical protein
VEQRREGVPLCLLAIDHPSAHRLKANLPRPESDHKPEPGEEKYAAMYTDDIEQRYRASLVVDWVELWCLPKQGDVEPDHTVGSFVWCGSIGFSGRKS